MGGFVQARPVFSFSLSKRCDVAEKQSLQGLLVITYLYEICTDQSTSYCSIGISQSIFICIERGSDTATPNFNYLPRCINKEFVFRMIEGRERIETKNVCSIRKLKMYNIKYGSRYVMET